MKKQKSERRLGAAAVELAVASPLLVLLIMGSIDLGQFINVGQVVSNASRVGARKATQFDVKNTADVETSVKNYLKGYFSLSDSEVNNAVTVTVKNSSGSTISSSALGNISDGAPVSVEVDFQFSSVRWVSGLPELSNKSVSVTTTMRRQ